MKNSFLNYLNLYVLFQPLERKVAKKFLNFALFLIPSEGMAGNMTMESFKKFVWNSWLEDLSSSDSPLRFSLSRIQEAWMIRRDCKSE